MQVIVDLLVDGCAESEWVSDVAVVVGSLSCGDDDGSVVEYASHDWLLNHHALTLLEHEVEWSTLDESFLENHPFVRDDIALSSIDFQAPEEDDKEEYP